MFRRKQPEWITIATPLAGIHESNTSATTFTKERRKPMNDNTDLYRCIAMTRDPDRLEHWLQFNQTDFLNWYDENGFYCISGLPEYESEDYLE